MSIIDQLKCCECKKNIYNNHDIYMCIDNTFCSTSCRNKQLNYIKKFDPEFNHPDKWNKIKHKANVNCFIEIDYFKIPTLKSSKNINQSISMTNLLDYKERKLNETINKKMMITCIKVYMFNIKLNYKQIVILGTSCLMLIIYLSIIYFHN